MSSTFQESDFGLRQASQLGLLHGITLKRVDPAVMTLGHDGNQGYCAASYCTRSNTLPEVVLISLPHKWRP